MAEENKNFQEGIDTVTARPRTPNDPYTRLTDTQIRNIQKETSPHFHVMPNPSGAGGQSANGPGREGGRHYVDRYTEVKSLFFIPLSQLLLSQWWYSDRFTVIYLNNKRIVFFYKLTS